uniref:NHL repeat-containing protein 2 n=1 Tax=Aegilops tauschii subsp. strangulata TaxID=200361 RepID=A0A453AUG5_AEGTS
MASPPRVLLGHALLLTPLLPLLACAGLVLEDGYTVSTVSDLNPTGTHPYALLPRPRAGDLVLLDSAGSTLYTLPLPVSADAGPRRLAGGAGAFGHGHPRSIAVDGADNVYVADRANGSIRKVAPSGYTTTIAGAYSVGTGHRDEPAQNATFSADFELIYVPKICALLVADRGNRLIRQIKLKPEDCAHENQKGLGTTSASIIAILAALFGSIIGFLARHFYPFHEVSINRFFSRIQRQYRRTQRKAALISFSDIRNAIANSMLSTVLLKLVRVSVGYLTVVLPSIRLERGVACKPSPSSPSPPSLLDLDMASTTTPAIGLGNEALPSTELLGDFVGFDDSDSATDEGNESAFDGSAPQDENKETSLDRDLLALLDIQQGSYKKIDNMIEANLSDFSGQDKYCSPAVNYSGVSRRFHGGSKVA